MYKYFLLALFLPSITYTQTWEETLKAKHALLQNPAFARILQQQAAFASKAALTIANQAIKDIAIQDNGEEVVDTRAMKHARITMLADGPAGKAFSSPDCNSGLPSASKMRKGIWTKLELMLLALDELSKDFGYKPQQLDIKVFEGLRDLETQQKLFKNKADEIRSQNANWTDEQVEAETSKWVAPYKNNVPPHSTGAAVDIRLWDNVKKSFLDVGMFGVIWGANPNAPTFSEGITDDQKLNRLYLLMAATKAGLINYVYEHWHFSAGDRYAVHWTKEAPAACYGAL